MSEKYRHVGSYAKLYCLRCRERTKKVCLDIAVSFSNTPGVTARTHVHPEGIQASNYFSIGKKTTTSCAVLLQDPRALPSPYRVSQQRCVLQLNFLSSVTDVTQRRAPARVPELTADAGSSSVH